MQNICLFTNQNSGRNLRDRYRVKSFRTLLEKHGHGQVFSTKSKDDLEKAVSELHKKEPDSIVIDGGDGSWTAFLSMLMQYWPKEKELPPFGLMPGGTFNILSKQCGVKRQKYLEEIMRADDDELYIDEIDMFRVKDNNGMESYGFSFGIGAPVTLLDEVYKRKRMKYIRIFYMAIRLALSRVFRDKYYQLFNKKNPLEVKAFVKKTDNGGGYEEKDYSGNFLGMLVQTIEGLGIRGGKKAFYKANRPKHFHAMGTEMDIGTFFDYAWPFLRGRPIPGMHLDIQSNKTSIRAKEPVVYQINGEKDFFGVPYHANEMILEHGLTVEIIKPSLKKKS